MSDDVFWPLEFAIDLVKIIALPTLGAAVCGISASYVVGEWAGVVAVWISFPVTYIHQQIRNERRQVKAMREELLIIEQQMNS